MCTYAICRFGIKHVIYSDAIGKLIYAKIDELAKETTYVTLGVRDAGDFHVVMREALKFIS